MTNTADYVRVKYDLTKRFANKIPSVEIKAIQEGHSVLHEYLAIFPNTTIAEFANTIDADEMAHNELSHLEPDVMAHNKLSHLVL